jgi:hypothetical protein
MNLFDPGFGMKKFVYRINPGFAALIFRKKTIQAEKNMSEILSFFFKITLLVSVKTYNWESSFKTIF